MSHKGSDSTTFSCPGIEEMEFWCKNQSKIEVLGPNHHQVMFVLYVE